MIRGVRNPFPAITKMTNSGIFSDGTKGQKLDKQPRMPRGVTRAVTVSMLSPRKIPLAGGMSAGKVQTSAMRSARKIPGAGGTSARKVQTSAMRSDRKIPGAGGMSASKVQTSAMQSARKTGRKTG